MMAPISVADIKEAMLPPINAFTPNSDKVFLCPGANEPMPPIWIPMLAKLAKPQSM